MSQVTKLEPFPRSKGTNISSLQRHVDWYYFRQSGYTPAACTLALYSVLNERLFQLINDHSGCLTYFTHKADIPDTRNKCLTRVEAMQHKALTQLKHTGAFELTGK